MGRFLLLKNADYIVSCDDADMLYKNVDVLCEDGIIIGIDQELSGPDGAMTIEARGMAVYPGLINTHHHLYQTFSRNLPWLQNLELFNWLKASYQIWKNLNQDVVLYSSLTGLGELLKYGCTTCVDHHYVFPKGAGGLLNAQFEAADRLGIRLHAARGSMDLSNKDGGLPPDNVVQTIDEILRDGEDAVRAYHDPAPFSMHRVMLAPCSPFSVSSELLRQSALQARHLGVRLHTHVAETKDEEYYTLERFGVRPLEYLEQLGWTGPDVWYAHGIHFDDDELRHLAETGVGVAHCPVSNMKLSSGVCRIPEMLLLDIPVGLAVDGSSSNDGSNLLEELRIGYLLHRLVSSSNAPSGYDMLKIATKGGAQLLGRDDIGALAVGKAADFFAVRLDRFEWNGVTLDPMSMLGTVGCKCPVDITVVNGRVAVLDGRLTGVDECKIVEASKLTLQKYLASEL